MKKIKLICQIVAAFVIALFAYNIFYQPHSESVKAQVKQKLPAVLQQEDASKGLPAGKLRITMLNIGQGDALLLQDGKQTVMVDVGDSRVRKSKDGKVSDNGGKDALVRTPRLIGKGRESLPRILPQICRACSDAERAADAASHATQKIKIAQYYEDRLGERYAGTVSWVSSMGLFVRLDLTQVEGLVSIKSLGNEWFEFDEDALTLTGADTGTRYKLGQRVIIEVSRVNTTRGHLDFKLIH